MLKGAIKKLLDEVVRIRIADPQEWTRKLVLDGLHSLEYNELRAALQVDQNLLEIVVDALRDQKEVQKSALALLANVLNRYELQESSNNVLKSDVWLKIFQRSKLQLIKLCRMQETQISLKAIQVLHGMVQAVGETEELVG